jgi:hypothetical protein
MLSVVCTRRAWRYAVPSTKPGKRPPTSNAIVSMASPPLFPPATRHWNPSNCCVAPKPPIWAPAPWNNSKNSLSTSVRSTSLALEARAHARGGDLAGAEGALSRAEQALDMRTEPQTRSFLSFDMPYVPYYAGTTYVWLGEAARARTWTGQAIELCDADPVLWPVARTSARIDLAVALTHAEELDGAVAVGKEAMDIWAQRPTHPARKRIEELLAALRPFTVACVVELRERWRWISR